MSDVLPTTVQNVQQPASGRRFNEPRLLPRGRRRQQCSQESRKGSALDFNWIQCYLHHIIWPYRQLLCKRKSEGAGFWKKKKLGEDESVAAGKLCSPMLQVYEEDLKDLREILPRWRSAVAVASLTDRVISKVPGEY